MYKIEVTWYMFSEWTINEWTFKMLCRKCCEDKEERMTGSVIYRVGGVWTVY